MTRPDFGKVFQQIEGIVNANPKDLLLQICSTLKAEVYHYDWVGLYVLDGAKNELVLGPFVGKPTQHTHIAVGKGICGQVAASGETMVVQDVTQVDNYISCGLEVQSEIVVPILKDGRFIAEIDIDSHSAAPFTEEDSVFLNKVAELIKDQFTD
jgi:GAF domain-containing protein